MVSSSLTTTEPKKSQILLTNSLPTTKRTKYFTNITSPNRITITLKGQILENQETIKSLFLPKSWILIHWADSLGGCLSHLYFQLCIMNIYFNWLVRFFIGSCNFSHTYQSKTRLQRKVNPETNSCILVLYQIAFIFLKFCVLYVSFWTPNGHNNIHVIIYISIHELWRRGRT